MEKITILLRNNDTDRYCSHNLVIGKCQIFPDCVELHSIGEWHKFKDYSQVRKCINKNSCIKLHMDLDGSMEMYKKRKEHIKYMINLNL